MSDEAAIPPSSITAEEIIEASASSADKEEAAAMPTEPTTTTTTAIIGEQSKNLTAADTKVELILKPVGDAPIMKQKKWTLPGSRTVGWVHAFVRKYLKFAASDSLFLYVNQSFAPSPDHTMQNLFDCFGSDGKLVINYSKTQAWG